MLRKQRFSWDSFLKSVCLSVCGLVSATKPFPRFYDRMSVHRNRFLVNKTNRCAEFQFYWYYDSTCFGQPFCPSSGVLSRTSSLVHFMQLWWSFVMTVCDDRLLTGVGWNCLQFHPTPVSKRSLQLHKMYQSRSTAKNSWWWAEMLPETCRVVISIKLEFGASVGFIHKESLPKYIKLLGVV